MDDALGDQEEVAGLSPIDGARARQDGSPEASNGSDRRCIGGGTPSSTTGSRGGCVGACRRMGDAGGTPSGYNKRWAPSACALAPTSDGAGKAQGGRATTAGTIAATSDEGGRSPIATGWPTGTQMAGGWGCGPGPSTPLGTELELAGRRRLAVPKGVDAGARSPKAVELVEARHACRSAAAEECRVGAPCAGRGATGGKLLAAPREGGVHAWGPVAEAKGAVGRAVSPGGWSAMKAGAPFVARSVSAAGGLGRGCRRQR